MSIYPTLRYDDATAAIAFLTSAFGLTPEEVNINDDGTIGHAELSWDGGVIMLGTRSDPPGEFDTGQAVIYLVVEDVEAHHARAAAAGANIAYPPVERSYGSREYGALDPEGNVWSFGTYRPKISSAAAAATAN